MNSTEALNPSRCLKAAWELSKRAPAAVWVAGLVVILVDSSQSKLRLDNWGGFGGAFPQGSFGRLTQWFSISIGVPSLALVALLIGAAVAWLRLGYFRGLQRLMGTGHAELGQMYESGGRWLPFYLTWLLKAGLVVLSSAPLFLLGIGQVLIWTHSSDHPSAPGAFMWVGFLVYLPVMAYILIGLTWMPYAVALRGRSPLEALGDSWQLAAGHRLQIFLIGAMRMALSFVGLLACCVGVLAALILTEVIWLEAYVQLTGGADNGPVAVEGTQPIEPDPDPIQERPQTIESPVDEPPATVEPFDPSAWRHDMDLPSGEDDPQA